MKHSNKTIQTAVSPEFRLFCITKNTQNYVSNCFAGKKKAEISFCFRKAAKKDFSRKSSVPALPIGQGGQSLVGRSGVGWSKAVGREVGWGEVRTKGYVVALLEG
jgi:hypothetical protein